MEKPTRKLTRMKGYDYSQEAAFFVTICAHENKHIFGEISKIDGVNVFTPSRIGEIVEEIFFQLPARFPEFELTHFCLLPNHLHFLVLKNEIELPKKRSLSEFVGAFKSLSDRAARNEMSFVRIWQKSFNDHIIRNEKDYQTHWLYIEENVNRWGDDQYFL